MPIPLLLLGLVLVAAQAVPGAMRARLSPVPLDVAMQETIAGQGTATAALAGTTLTVDGTYRGLKSAATALRVFESAKLGLRGPLVGFWQTPATEKWRPWTRWWSRLHFATIAQF